MGRPRKGEEKNRPVHLGFKVTEKMNADLRKLARKRRSPMSDVVVELLEKGLQDAANTNGQHGKPTRGSA